MRFLALLIVLVPAVAQGQTVSIDGRNLAPVGNNTYRATYTAHGRTERIEARIWTDDQFWHVSAFDTGVTNAAFSRIGRRPLVGTFRLTNPTEEANGTGRFLSLTVTP